MNEDALFTLYLVVSAVLSFYIGNKFKYLNWIPFLGVGTFVVGVFVFGWVLISVLL